MLLDQYWEKKAIPYAETAIEKAGIAGDRKASRIVLFGDVFPSFNTPTPLQRFVAECAISGTPQLFILEDITGSGKTEAALFLARRMMTEGAGKGFFLALPTMATSNAMFDRLAEKPSPTEFPVYRRLFEQSAEPSIVLAHSARHLSETFMKSIVNSEQGESEYEESEETAAAQCASWLADNRKKALLADVGVGTLDQALLAILPSRFQSLRLFGLAGNILIVDEAHAYDPYMNMLLQNLLTFHGAMGGSAILLSATLPQHIRQAMLNSFAKGIGIEAQAIESNDYPLATSISHENGVGETSIEAMPQRKTSVAVRL
jgi:CRISPR-associated endonuclease/helicase Cas3